jgi:hypothetical protein
VTHRSKKKKIGRERERERVEEEVEEEKIGHNFAVEPCPCL